jgi:Zn-dependent protease
MGVPLDVRAVISLAGPFAGLLSSAACVLIYYYTHSTLWLALARAGAWLNLLNLIPVWALDGGHAIQAVSKYGRILFLTGAVLLYWLSSDMLFLLLAAGAAWQSFFTRAPQEGSTKIAIYFALLLCGLAAVLWLAPGQGFELR